jgi:hypothetical protein
MRIQHRARRIVRKALPRIGAKQDRARFDALMNFAGFEELRYSYRLPTALHDEQSSDW